MSTQSRTKQGAVLIHRGACSTNNNSQAISQAARQAARQSARQQRASQGDIIKMKHDLNMFSLQQFPWKEEVLPTTAHRFHVWDSSGEGITVTLSHENLSHLFVFMWHVYAHVKFIFQRCCAHVQGRVRVLCLRCFSPARGCYDWECPVANNEGHHLCIIYPLSILSH